ncbi:MAG TPA: VTT domain-containing protein [Candidatus Saccharimonadales bacterium]
MFGLDPEAIAQAGLWLIALIIFTESGLLVGFFLPGDTLLFAAGILASQGGLNIWLTIAAIATAAIVGDNVGYTIGRYSGKRLFHKKDGILFKQEYVERAQKFYEKYGGLTIILARFTPIVRTFAPLVAGIGKMDRRLFFLYNVVGALLWSTSVTLLGYYVGGRFPELIHYMEYVIIGVVVLSIAPAIWHIVSDERSRQLLLSKLRRHQK